MAGYQPKKVWRDGYGPQETRLMAADLNHIEQGIINADANSDAATKAAEAATKAAQQAVIDAQKAVEQTLAATAARITGLENKYQEAMKFLQTMEKIPIGTVFFYTGGPSPDQDVWLFCDGTNVSKKLYPKLAEICGTRFGPGDDDFFALPNMEKRVPVGAGGSYTAGKMGGEETHLLTVDEIPAHNHPVGATADGWETIGIWGTNVSGGDAWKLLARQAEGSEGRLVTRDVGGNIAHSIMQPYVVLTALIKAK